MSASRLGHTPLYVVELTGNSRARGVQHGQLLKDPIRRAVEFYRRFFAQHLRIDVTEMRRRAARFLEPIQRLSANLFREYEGIAEGSGQKLEDILALSARYEITYEHVRLGECSNVFVGAERTAGGHTLLGM